MRNPFHSTLLAIGIAAAISICAPSDAKPAAKRKAAPQRSSWFFGGQFGINFAFAHSSPSSEGSTRQGLILGALWQTRLAGNLFFQPEVRYIQKGVNSVKDILGISLGVTVILDSLEVPLLLKYKFGKPRFNPYIAFGPTLSMVLKRDIEPLNVEKFRWYDVGAIVGGGAEFLISRTLLGFVGARFSAGFLDMRESPDFKFFNRGLELVAGVITVL